MIRRKSCDRIGREDHATVRCPKEAAAALEDIFSLLFKYMEDLSEIADYAWQERSIF